MKSFSVKLDPLLTHQKKKKTLKEKVSTDVKEVASLRKCTGKSSSLDHFFNGNQSKYASLYFQSTTFFYF